MEFLNFIEYLTSDLFEFLLELSSAFTEFLVSIYDGVCSVGNNTLSNFLLLFVNDNLGSIFSENFFYFVIGLFTLALFLKLFSYIIKLVK